MKRFLKIALLLVVIAAVSVGMLGMYPTPCGAPTHDQAKKALSQQRFDLTTLAGQPLDGVVPGIYKFTFSAASLRTLAAVYNLPADVTLAQLMELLSAKGVQFRALDGGELQAAKFEVTMDGSKYTPCPSGPGGSTATVATPALGIALFAALALLLVAIVIVSRRRGSANLLGGAR